MRILLQDAVPLFDKIPSANGKEHSDEHSNVNAGPVVEQALTLLSSEVGERRRAPDAIISSHNGGKEVDHAYSTSATFTLPASSPISPSGHPVCAMALRQSLDSPLPLVKVIPRRREPGIISKASGENNIRSQVGLLTAERQSFPLLTDARSEGGEQLVRAAAHIQEHLTRCSSACDKFVSRKLKVLPDKKAEPDMQQHVIHETEKARASLCSPESLMESELIFWSQIKAVPLLQPNGEMQAALLRLGTLRANELYTESSESAQISTELKYETSDDGVRERRSALSIEAVKADRYSFEHLAETKGVPEELVTPAHTETVRHSCENLIRKRGVREHPHSHVAPAAGLSPKKSDHSSQSLSVPSLGILRAKAQEQPIKAVLKMAPLLSEGRLS
ncbi:hypothetical protein AX14_004483, partial [Amanita brunnescens Koide BX004]